MALLEVKGLMKYFDLSGGIVSQMFGSKKILKAKILLQGLGLQT